MVVAKPQTLSILCIELKSSARNLIRFDFYLSKVQTTSSITTETTTTATVAAAEAKNNNSYINSSYDLSSYHNWMS